ATTTVTGTATYAAAAYGAVAGRRRGGTDDRRTPTGGRRLRRPVDILPPPAAREPPVHLGAEDDHVRHNVEPDEQNRSRAERLERGNLLGVPEEDRQRLEGELERHCGEHGAGPHLTPAQALVRESEVGRDEEEEDSQRRDEERQQV